jgi:hypothetical protein
MLVKEDSSLISFVSEQESLPAFKNPLKRIKREREDEVDRGIWSEMTDQNRIPQLHAYSLRSITSTILSGPAEVSLLSLVCSGL